MKTTVDNSALEPAALSKQEAAAEAWSRLRRVSDIAHNAATADRLPSSTARQVLADIVTLSECYGASPVPAEPPARPTGHVEIAHDGFAGDIIGHYQTREGKRGVVVQQDGTRVVHVYGEKWLAPAPHGEGA